MGDIKRKSTAFGKYSTAADHFTAWLKIGAIQSGHKGQNY